MTLPHPNHHLPVYNIKAVSHLVGLLPVTLRAWERRYGLPLPQRGDQGYRLYSEYDVRMLRWIKSQLDAGLSISRAVEYLNELRILGKDPAEELPNIRPQPSVATQHLVQHLRLALEHFNDGAAAEILRQALTVYTIDTVLTEIIQPTLVEFGEAWHRGELPIAVEHFATQFCMQYLNTLATSSAPPTREGILTAACAPGETHQIGLLSLVVMLRWRGWEVKYLGPDLKLERIEEALVPLKPKVMLFTATMPQNAARLGEIGAILERFPDPKPLLVLGGRAFHEFRLPDSIPAIYLDDSPARTVAMIEQLALEANSTEAHL
jgi:DNA-binding transcriptional MerR regulator